MRIWQCSPQPGWERVHTHQCALEVPPSGGVGVSPVEGQVTFFGQGNAERVCAPATPAHPFLPRDPQIHLLDAAQAALPPVRSLQSIMKTIRIPIFSFLLSCSIDDRTANASKLYTFTKVIQ